MSTTDQDLTLQEAALRTAGCQVICSEKKTGTQREVRTELDILLRFLRAGDTLVITRNDRLARLLKPPGPHARVRGYAAWSVR